MCSAIALPERGIKDALSVTGALDSRTMHDCSAIGHSGASEQRSL